MERTVFRLGIDVGGTNTNAALMRANEVVATAKSFTSADVKSGVCTVEIRNEFLAARINGETVAIVPDLIAILDRESGEPLTGEALAYGQRVKVLGYAADPMLYRPESLAVLGPRQFAIDEDFRPLR